MHFDDRIATVLRQPQSGMAIARIQYRQLVDLLGTLVGDEPSAVIDAAYLRLHELEGRIPAAELAGILREQSLRLRNPRLVAQLCSGASAVAQAAIGRATLSEAQWADLIPALPIAVRSFLRERRDLGEEALALLDWLGVRGRGLPPSTAQEVTPAPPATTELPPAFAGATVVPFESRSRSENRAVAPEADDDAAPEAGQAIRAIVRRIEEFRKTREPVGHPRSQDDHPELPLETLEPNSRRRIEAFDFAASAAGRVTWADPGCASMVVGQMLFADDGATGILGDKFKARQPVRGGEAILAGAPAIAGPWRIDAVPEFEHETGRFTGYLGRMRRAMAGSGMDERAGDEGSSQDDILRLREIVHELKTPVNSIQGYAEMIQQSIVRQVPHEYRAYAAVIASEAAHVLAALDEFDRLARLEAGSLRLLEGQCDLAGIVRETVARINGSMKNRDSGFSFEGFDCPAFVPIDQAEIEGLVWRTLAPLAGACAPGERLGIVLERGEGGPSLAIDLPAALAARSDENLFSSSGERQQQMPLASRLGTGFALRLAVAEARAAGGEMSRCDNKLRIVLPDLTIASRDHSQGHQANAGQ